MATVYCKVKSVDAITETIYRVQLAPEKKFSFRAGQYLKILLDNKTTHIFSMASAPYEKKIIELHISISKVNPNKPTIINQILKKNKILIDFPYGKAWFRDQENRPLLLIAGGIGFAYIRSILFTALLKNPEHNIIVYWGVKEETHLYDLNELIALTIHHPNLHIETMVTHPKKKWNGRIGTVLNAILQDHHTLKDYDIYIAGHFKMSKIIRDVLCNQKNARKDRFFSDAFSFFDSQIFRSLKELPYHIT